MKGAHKARARGVGAGWALTAMAWPKPYQMRQPTHASSRFLRRMFLVFFARTVPASRSAKPHCMKKTRKAQIMSQRVSAERASRAPAVV